MHDALQVAVVQRCEDLSEGAGSETLVEVLFLNDAVEQFATFADLRYQVYFLLVFKVLVELENVWVVL